MRFSQELAEDYQLVLLERGNHSYVSTFDGHPYVAPFSGNIVELCPVGALTSRAYRFRARPWDVEEAGSVCTLCPSQCNVTLTVRDERALRVLARDNSEVDDGWLCDKGRFAYQSFNVDERVTEPLLRDGGQLRPVSWERALEEAATRLARAGAGTAAIAGGQSTNEEGLLLGRLMRDALGSPHIDSRRAGTLALERHRALGDPRLQARVSDLEFAHAVLVLDTEPVHDAPILDLRLRKGVRRHGLKLAVASPHPSSLDEDSTLSLRFRPGAGAAFAAALSAALAELKDAQPQDAQPQDAQAGDTRRADIRGDDVERLAGEAGADPQAVRKLAALLRGTGTPTPAGDGAGAPREIVALWGERLTAGPNGDAGARALFGIADALGMAGTEGAGLLEVPAGANGRGLREAGVLPNAGPGLCEPRWAAGGSDPGEVTGVPTGDRPASHHPRDARGIAEGLAEGELSALYLLHADPLRDLPDRRRWQRALAGASTIVAHASFLTEAIREHADVVFPAESYAEKEGTIVHPDGRLQRLRPATARPGAVRAEWWVLTELALRLGLDLDVLSGAMASQRLFAAVPFYAGLTLEEIGGRGVRWQERAAAAAFPRADAEPVRRGEPQLVRTPRDAADVTAYRSLWDAPEVEFSPALEFLFARAHTELEAPGGAAGPGPLDAVHSDQDPGPAGLDAVRS